MSSRGTLLWAFVWLCAAGASITFSIEAFADESSSVYQGSYRERQRASRDSRDNYSARNDVKQTGHAEPMRSREYFDPRGDDPRYAMRGRTISHAVHQEPTLADGVIIDGAPSMPLAAPEQMPMPGVVDAGAVPPSGALPPSGAVRRGMIRRGRAMYGPTQYGAVSQGPMEYGPTEFGPTEYGSAEFGPGMGGHGGCNECEDCGNSCRPGCFLDGCLFDGCLFDGCLFDGFRSGCGGCDDCDRGDPCDDWSIGTDMTLFGGVHGFKGPSDGGQNGNFGFQEGINWGGPFWRTRGIGFQLGALAVQSNLDGTASFDDTRSQLFVTAGFFRRQMCGYGWQWGLVYDQLTDEFDEEFDAAQARGEVSYLWRGHELGLWFTSEVSDGDSGEGAELIRFEPIDMSAVFYRRRMMSGGEARFWGGLTGDSDGILGADFRTPLSCDWELVANFNYIIPQDNDNELVDSNEAWNIGINLVWYVCRDGALKAGCSPYRPLLNVADNGTFVVDRVR